MSHYSLSLTFIKRLRLFFEANCRLLTSCYRTSGYVAENTCSPRQSYFSNHLSFWRQGYLQLLLRVVSLDQPCAMYVYRVCFLPYRYQTILIGAVQVQAKIAAARKASKVLLVSQIDRQTDRWLQCCPPCLHPAACVRCALLALSLTEQGHAVVSLGTARNKYLNEM